MSRLISATLMFMILMVSNGCNDEIELPEVTATYPVVEVARPLNVADTVRSSAVRLEVGYEFVPSVDGQLQSITGILPGTGVYQVTLWEGFSQLQLATWEIEFIRNVYQETFVEDPVNLTAGKSYMITFNTIDYYVYEPPPTGTIFPQTVGDIEIVRFGTKVAFQPEFPTNFTNNQMYGLVDFRFEPIR